MTTATSPTAVKSPANALNATHSEGDVMKPNGIDVGRMNGVGHEALDLAETVSLSCPAQPFSAPHHGFDGVWMLCSRALTCADSHADRRVFQAVPRGGIPLEYSQVNIGLTPPHSVSRTFARTTNADGSNDGLVSKSKCDNSKLIIWKKNKTLRVAALRNRSLRQT